MGSIHHNRGDARGVTKRPSVNLILSVCRSQGDFLRLLRIHTGNMARTRRRMPSLHRLCTASVRLCTASVRLRTVSVRIGTASTTEIVLALFAYRFSPYWDRFDNGNPVVEAVPIRTETVRRFPLSKRSQYGLKRYANGLKRYANGARTASVYSRLSPSYARAYGPFSLCHL